MFRVQMYDILKHKTRKTYQKDITLLFNLYIRTNLYIFVLK
jgi:hypothetical protein